jgi:hypothetical protein
VIAAATHPHRGPLYTALSVAPLRALGLISYGLYLWHWPIYVYLDEQRTGLEGLELLAVRLGVTLVIALLSYRFIEQPIRRRRVPERAVWIATPAVVALLVVALFASTTPTALPVRGRFATKSVPVPGTATWNRILALYKSTAAQSGSATRVLMIGDSISEILGPNPADKRLHTASAAFGLVGCSIVDGELVIDGYAQELNPSCAAWPQLLREVIDEYDPDVGVVMLGPWEMFDRQRNGVQYQAGSQPLTDLLLKQLETQRKIITSRGATELLLTTPCYDPPPTPHHEDQIWKDPARRAWLNGIWRQFAAAHPADVRLGNLGTFVCPGGKPRKATNGEPLRMDGIHFSPAGSATIWPWVSGEVAALRAHGRISRR